MEFKFAIVHTMHTHILFWVPNTYYVLHSMENTNHVAFTLREVYKSSVSCYVVVVVVVVVSDAIVVLEGQLVNGGTDGATLSLGSGDTVSLKVQSSKKTATYSIAKVYITHAGLVTNSSLLRNQYSSTDSCTYIRYGMSCKPFG